MNPPPEETYTSPLRDRNYRIILAVTLMAVIGFTSIMPAIPEIMNSLGVAASEIGLVLTSFAFAAMIITPVAGMLADRLGRKQVLAPALLLFAGFGVACSFAQNFEQLLVLRFLQGLGAGQLNVVTMTMVSDMYQGRQRAQAMGYIGATVSLGSAGAAFVGGIIAAWGWRYVFYLPGLGFVCWALVAFALKVPEPQKDGQGMGGYLRAAIRLILTRQVGGLMLATMFAMLLLNGAFVTYAPIFLFERFGLDPEHIGFVLMVVTLFVGVVATQIGKLTVWFGQKKLIIAGFSLYSLSMALVPLCGSVWVSTATLSLLGLGHGMIMPSVLGLLADHAPTELRAVVMSANGTTMRLGQTLAPVLMGAVYAFHGLDGVFYGSMFIGLAGIAAVLLLVRQRF